MARSAYITAFQRVFGDAGRLCALAAAAEAALSDLHDDDDARVDPEADPAAVVGRIGHDRGGYVTPPAVRPASTSPPKGVDAVAQPPSASSAVSTVTHGDADGAVGSATSSGGSVGPRPDLSSPFVAVPRALASAFSALQRGV